MGRLSYEIHFSVWSKAVFELHFISEKDSCLCGVVFFPFPERVV